MLKGIFIEQVKYNPNKDELNTKIKDLEILFLIRLAHGL